uniref:Uncharacterized protein n=1 Tax=Leptobrachium leishanense TaxID=445787 RepID=A0A8C5N4K1_9ANUR
MSSTFMASADLRDELTCCICTDIYIDPVTLTCGHSFCRICITKTWDNQEEREYSCPACRHKFRVRPELKRALGLHNIVERIVWKRECSLHKKVLEYYCCQDMTCICASCRLAVEHGGHQVETLTEASEKKKEKLKNILGKLTLAREETEKTLENLQGHKTQVKRNAAELAEQITDLIKGIKERLESLEKRAMSEISRQEERVSRRVLGLIGKLDSKKEELSRKMEHIQEMCNMTDLLTFLQEQESDRVDYCDTEEGDKADTERHDIEVHDARMIFLQDSGKLLGVRTPTDVLLDINTASNFISLSVDLKSLSWSEINQGRPETPERFQDYPQVLSSKSFSSGRHYWELGGSISARWIAGLAYPSIDRRGDKSEIGNNNKSWGLGRRLHKYYINHDSKETQLLHSTSSQRFGIFLDYEAGRLSFYELGVQIRPLHTFNATFTEPLHFIMRVFNSIPDNDVCGC